MLKKIILIILDGWGITKDKASSAIEKASTPFIDQLFIKYKNSLLKASGKAVGLPNNIMGNSEVGHINIGAGRIVLQSLMKINKAIKQRELNKNNILINALNYAKKENKNIHLIGLVSDGGIHSHINHLKALCTIAKDNNIKNLFIHAFTDGRDSDPKSSILFLKDLENHINTTVGKLATIIGRYYAMDRDKKWERTKLAYDALVNNIGERSDNLETAVLNSYAKGITDEFLKPIILTNKDGIPLTNIKNGDVVINFNFRTDRPKQITQMLTQKEFVEYNTIPLNLKYITFTTYDQNYKNVEVLFKQKILKNTLGEVLSKNGLSQIRIAETEKYPHITYFFSGGREKPFKNEKRILCPSPKVATYDLKPEMSAYDIKNKTLEIIEKNNQDFICINFANADMVGHTGDFSATIKACETVDICLKEIVNKAIDKNYIIIITSDHGNAEKMFGNEGNPFTAHTKNKVPFIIVNHENHENLKNGILANIAPTILKLFNIDKPDEMNENSLI